MLMMCNVSSFLGISYLQMTTVFRSRYDIKLLSKEISHVLIALSQLFFINKLLINFKKLNTCHLQIKDH